MQKKQFSARPRRVALFVTCMVDMMYPNVGMATVELLERFGIEVIFPDEQTCCGQPAFNAGFRDDTRLLARRFIDIFEPLIQNGYVDAIVAPSGSCTTMTTHFYPLLFEEIQAHDRGATATFHRAQRLAEATFELSEFLVDVLGIEDVQAHFSGKVAYHACCHLLRELGIDAQPRALLANVQEAELVDLEGDTECCGFGGLFAVKNPGISTAMGQRKTRHLATSGADVVVMCDVSCMTHINGLLEKQSQRCRAVHLAEVLNHQIEVEPDESNPSREERPINRQGKANAAERSAKPATSGPTGARQIAPKPAAEKPATPKTDTPKPAGPKPRRWQDV